MDMQRNIYLHIGTHKTGSTAVQKFLDRNRKSLAAAGCGYYSGSIFSENHVELYLASMRPDRDSLAKQKMNLSIDDGFIANTRNQVSEFLKSNHFDNYVFSCEGLALLRFDDEMEILKSIFNPLKDRVHIVVVLRDRDAYLEAYKRQILKMPGRELSSNPASAFYVEKDSWLADFDALIDLYARGFGREKIYVVNYDGEMMADGDVLPAVLRAMKIPAKYIPAPGVEAKENRTTWRHTLKRRFPFVWRVLSFLWSKFSLIHNKGAG
jgi:hypothetical protein